MERMNIDKILKIILKIFFIECLILGGYLLSFFIFLAPLSILNIDLGMSGDTIGMLFVMGFVTLLGIVSTSAILAIIALLVYLIRNGLKTTWEEFKSIFINYKGTLRDFLKYYYKIYLWCGPLAILAAFWYISTLSFIDDVSTCIWYLWSGFAFFGSLVGIPIILLSSITALIYLFSNGLNQTLLELKNFLEQEKATKFTLKIIAFIISTLAVILVSFAIIKLCYIRDISHWDLKNAVPIEKIK